MKIDQNQNPSVPTIQNPDDIGSPENPNGIPLNIPRSIRDSNPSSSIDRFNNLNANQQVSEGRNMASGNHSNRRVLGGPPGPFSDNRQPVTRYSGRLLGGRSISPDSSNRRDPIVFRTSSIQTDPRPIPEYTGFQDLNNLLNFMLLRRDDGEFERLINSLQGNKGLDKGILNSLAVIKYNENKSRNLDSELKRCPVCLEEFEDQAEVKFLKCLHRFHKDCINQWLNNSTVCPVCKKDQSHN